MLIDDLKEIKKLKRNLENTHDEDKPDLWDALCLIDKMLELQEKIINKIEHE